MVLLGYVSAFLFFNFGLQFQVKSADGKVKKEKENGFSR